MADKKICFVVAPIGKEGTEIRERSNIIFEHVIKPGVTPFGYEAQRADIPAEPGMITPQILRHLMNDPLVIADLTGGNPNVFYELSLRHAVRKPCIHIIGSNDEIPFDVSQLRTSSIDHTHIPTVKKVIQEIGEQVKEIESDTFKMQTPISVSLDIAALEASGDDIKSTSGVIMEMLYNIKNEIKRLEESLHPAHSDRDVLRNLKEEFLAGPLSKGLLSKNRETYPFLEQLMESIEKEKEARKKKTDSHPSKDS